MSTKSKFKKADELLKKVNKIDNPEFKDLPSIIELKKKVQDLRDKEAQRIGKRLELKKK